MMLLTLCIVCGAPMSNWLLLASIWWLEIVSLQCRFSSISRAKLTLALSACGSQVTLHSVSLCRGTAPSDRSIQADGRALDVVSLVCSMCSPSTGALVYAESGRDTMAAGRVTNWRRLETITSGVSWIETGREAGTYFFLSAFFLRTPSLNDRPIPTMMYNYIEKRSPHSLLN